MARHIKRFLLSAVCTVENFEPRKHGTTNLQSKCLWKRWKLSHVMLFKYVDTYSLQHSNPKIYRTVSILYVVLNLLQVLVTWHQSNISRNNSASYFSVIKIAFNNKAWNTAFARKVEKRVMMHRINDLWVPLHKLAGYWILIQQYDVFEASVWSHFQVCLIKGKHSRSLWMMTVLKPEAVCLSLMIIPCCHQRATGQVVYYII